jgi:hypothetical protein
MKIKGVFTSVWDDDVEIVTKAILDTETGEVTAETAEVENLDILQREFFTSEEFANAGEEYEICPECHTFILKVVMKDGIGHTYEEVNVCSDPDCENQ